MDPAIQRQIGLRLREMYDGVLGDPIPDKFLELMKQLEDKDSNG